MVNFAWFTVECGSEAAAFLTHAPSVLHWPVVSAGRLIFVQLIDAWLQEPDTKAGGREKQESFLGAFVEGEIFRAGFAYHKQESRRISLQSSRGPILGVAIVWAAVVIACALALTGTECFGRILPLLGGGAAGTIVVVNRTARRKPRGTGEQAAGPNDPPAQNPRLG